MASEKEKNLIKEEKPESKETSYPDLGIGWKVQEVWIWREDRTNWERRKVYISPSRKKFKSLKSAQEHIDLVNKLGPDWTVKKYSSRKHYTYSPTGQDFPTLKQAKAYAKSLAEAATSNTQDEGEVEETMNDTGASSSTQDSPSNATEASDEAAEKDTRMNGGESKRAPRRWLSEIMKEWTDDVKKARSAFDEEKYREAIGICTSVLDTNPNNEVARELLVRAYIKMKDWENVISATTGITTTNIKIVASRGQANMRLGNIDEAISDFTHALTLSPTPSSITTLNEKIAKLIHIRGKIHLDNGQIDEAVDDFSCAVNHPDATSLTKCKAIMSHIKAGVVSDTAIAPPPFPSNMREWCNNTLLHEASSELDSAGPLKDAAVKFIRNFCAWDYKGNDLDMAEVLALFHFNPNNQNLHENGSLYSGDKNCTPRSPTSGPFCEIWARTWSYVFKLNLNDANTLTMQQVAWGDFINLDGDSDEATNSAKSAKFAEMVEETELLNLEFILENIDQLPNVKYMIICSNAAWEFYQKHMSKFPSRIEVLQDRSLVHTCLMSQTIGITYRQAFTLVNAIVDIQSKLIGLKTPPTVTEEVVRSIIGAKINSRTSDQYMYVGIRNGKIVLCASGCDAFEQLLINEGATTSNFPNQPTIQSNMDAGVSTLHAGLEVEMHTFDSPVVASLDTGPQEDIDEYKKWSKCTEKRQGYDGVRISSCITNVYVARYGPNNVIIFYSPDGCEELKNMIKKSGGAFAIFPSQADLKSGNAKEVAGLKIEMYAFDSKEAVELRSMNYGAQINTDAYKKCVEVWKKPKLFVHEVDLDTHRVVSVIGDPVSTLSGLNNCGNINITDKGTSTVNKELKKIDLNLGGTSKPHWSDHEKAMDSIDKGLSLFIYLRIDEQVPGCHVVSHASGDSYHLPFILAGVQLDPEENATVKGETVGILALDEDDFNAKVAKLKVLPKNERLNYNDTTDKCCKIKGCENRSCYRATDHMCKNHYNQFKKAGRNTKEGDDTICEFCERKFDSLQGLANHKHYCKKKKGDG